MAELNDPNEKELDLQLGLVEAVRSLKQRVSHLETLEGGILSYPLYSALPQLRAAWLFSSVDENGDLFDTSEQDRTLTNVAAAPFLVSNFAPYATLDGAAQHFTRGDEAGLRVTGALTLISLVNFDAAFSAFDPIAGKWQAAGSNNRSYLLQRKGADGLLRAQISTDGTAVVFVDSTTVVVPSNWAYCVLRFDPSAELSVFLGLQGGDNGTLEKVVNTTGIPASIFNSNADFTIGAINAATVASNFIDASVSLTFLCAAVVSDAMLNQHYAQVRQLFNI